MAAKPTEPTKRLTGLTAAQVNERVARGAVNTVPESPSRTTKEIVRANVVTRFNILLTALLLVILIAVRQPADALFGIVMITNAAIGIIQELRAKATLDRLSVLTTPTVTVIRDGGSFEVPAPSVVMDDLIELKTGDQVPVDGTVIESEALEIDESLLTGESDPILKEPGNRCLSGSFVVAGAGRFVATKVGEDAYAAALAKEAKRFTLVRSELRRGIDYILAGVSWAVAPVIILLVWSSFRASGDEFSFGSLFDAEALSSAVAGAVGMVPQGLVLLTSIAFAVGVIRLGRQQVLVQELPAIEGLARVDTVCFDKTGTLTEGNLVVQDVFPLTDRDPAEPLGALGAAEPSPNATLHAVIREFPAVPGWRADAAVPFSSARKWSGASFGSKGTWVLGAPEVVVPEAEEVVATATEHADLGRRVLVLAHSDLALQAERLPRRLEPHALVILGDRIRADAADTLRYFDRQGVQAKVISGDHPATVGAIAREVGVSGAQRVVDGRDLPEDRAELAAVMEENTVFGRVTPHQKREMVGALQDRGHVVAMTGDGVNDVLALKDSDIGIAIGTGSAAARAVAQLVLIDGSFATLPGVVGEGRRVISNIERVANLFVTKTVYAIFIALAVGLAGRPFPFLPRHLTLVGSVTIGIPAFFLALAPSADRAHPGFIMRVLRFAIPTGLAAGLATFGAYQLAIAEGGRDIGLDDVEVLAQARTTATLVLAALGLFALGIVARPLVPWKKGLLWTMAGFLLLLLLSDGSQRFFALELPRIGVLTAAVGIVAITGMAMIGTLRAVGWIKHVPELLRERPPDAGRLWRTARDRVKGMLPRPEAEPPAAHSDPAPGVDAAAPLPVEPEIAPPPPRPTEPIEWFDPDVDPVEILGEPAD
jgi:cation-transporting ATPase E